MKWRANRRPRMARRVRSAGFSPYLGRRIRPKGRTPNLHFTRLKCYQKLCFPFPRQNSPRPLCPAACPSRPARGPDGLDVFHFLHPRSTLPQRHPTAEHVPDLDPTAAFRPPPLEASGNTTARTATGRRLRRTKPPSPSFRQRGSGIGCPPRRGRPDCPDWRRATGFGTPFAYDNTWRMFRKQDKAGGQTGWGAVLLVWRITPGTFLAAVALAVSAPGGVVCADRLEIGHAA